MIDALEASAKVRLVTGNLKLFKRTLALFLAQELVMIKYNNGLIYNVTVDFYTHSVHTKIP